MNVRPKVSMLSEKDVQLVHESSLEILEKIGVLYENKQALDIMEANGQRVDRDKGVAWVKPDLVERCMKTAPRKFVLASRDGKNDAVIDAYVSGSASAKEPSGGSNNAIVTAARVMPDADASACGSSGLTTP